jgi:seryl-tRNA synthetase
LIGVTGGLAAPAIAALLAPLGIGGLLAGGAAPVVLGTLFGVGGGGLAGRRVRERWRGVEEFGFVEIGAGTKATTDEVEDLKQARERYQARKKKGEAEAAAEKTEGKAIQEKEEKGEKTEEEVSAEVEKDRLKLEEKLLGLSLSTSTLPEPESPRQSLDSAPTEKDIAKTNKPPSLTATIVVPGLLTVSKTEGITAWRAICAPEGEGVLPTTTESKDQGGLDAWKDGRDVYLLRFETATMLKSGRDIDHWGEFTLSYKLE